MASSSSHAHGNTWAHAVPSEHSDAQDHRPRRATQQQQQQHRYDLDRQDQPTFEGGGRAKAYRPERLDRNRPRRISRRAQPSEEFDEAVQHLEDVLSQAVAEFADLLHGFRQDVDPIADYAGQEVLQELWRRKVKWFVKEETSRGDRRPRRSTFAAVGDMLEEAIADVVTCAHSLQRRRGKSSPSSAPADTDDDFRLLLATKVEAARGALIGFLRRATKYQDGLKCFLTEAELVQTTIGKVSQAWRLDSEPEPAPESDMYQESLHELPRGWPPHQPGPQA